MNETDRPQAGILYIVATPIGNLEDITLRAVRILQEVDLIAAEDTRHTRKLLNHLRIETPQVSYYREKEKERAAELVEHLRAGMHIALVTDAGTPGISDPGAILVKEAREAGITVAPIPGPSAITAAISASGLDCSAFLFLGFCPAKQGQRRAFLQSVAGSAYPLVLYESPHRIRALLTDALEILGDRPAFWARELTKIHEDLRQEPLSRLLEQAEGQVSRGESALIIAPARTEPVAAQSVDDLLIWYRDHSGLSLKDACKRLSADLGISRSQVYQKALGMWRQTDGDSQQ
jgi:16S rRNA (cytidine1402-2'-O)-methyltransferase